MPSGGFRANGDFSQSSLSSRGNPNAEAFGQRACLSPSWAKARRASCAAAETAKDLWREKIDLSEKIDRGIKPAMQTAKIFSAGSETIKLNVAKVILALFGLLSMG